MKNLCKTIFAVFSFSFIISCTTQDKVADTDNFTQPENLTFIAEEANIESYSYNMEFNTANPTFKSDSPNLPIPPILVSGKAQTLSSGYGIIVQKDELEVKLPVIFQYNRNSPHNPESLNFISNDFSYVKKINKKGNSVVTIVARDKSINKKITMEIYKNGKTFVAVNSNGAKSMSYNGYIIRNSTAKN